MNRRDFAKTSMLAALGLALPLSGKPEKIVVHDYASGKVPALEVGKSRWMKYYDSTWNMTGLRVDYLSEKGDIYTFANRYYDDISDEEIRDMKFHMKEELKRQYGISI